MKTLKFVNENEPVQQGIIEINEDMEYSQDLVNFVLLLDTFSVLNEAAKRLMEKIHCTNLSLKQGSENIINGIDGQVELF